MNRSNRGFTLVELLVVITIIGVLVAIIIPGVSAVREISRQTQCLSNQVNIAKAILAYDQQKNHLPAILNQTQTTKGGTPVAIPFNWVEAIMPYLDATDVWNQVLEGNITPLTIQNGTPVPQVKVLICPNDPYLAQPLLQTYQGLMSYGINDGFFVRYAIPPTSPASLTSTPPLGPPTDLLSNQVAIASPSKLTSRPTGTFPRGETVSPSTTIMLGEMTGDGGPTYKHVAGPWTTITATYITSPPQPVNPTALTFHWPIQYQNQGSPLQISPNMMVSSHPDKVMVVFFDGHGQAVPSDTTYPQ